MGCASEGGEWVNCIGVDFTGVRLSGDGVRMFKS